MAQLDDWIAETYRWIKSPDEKERQSAMLRNEPMEPPAEFAPPTELDWPSHLLQSLPDFLEEYFQESRDIDLAAKRIDQVIENLAIWIQQYLHKLRQTPAGGTDDFEDSAHGMVLAWRKLYQAIQPFHAFRSEEIILRTLLTIPSPEAVDVWSELLIDYPPTLHRAAVSSVETLTRRPGWAADDLFPRLLDALEHPTTIAAILDLANWTMRHHADLEHPAKHLEQRLQSLLTAVVERLEIIESDPSRLGTDIRAIQRILDESVALCIALCDTLGLIENESSKPALVRASNLRHRRIVCEAAAALARLGEPDGKRILIELAAEPITRQRVLLYADELGFSDEIDDSWKSEHAKAESQLAMWLALPENFGIAPRQLELVDQRILMWPSYTEPQTCYLFRFVYPLTNGQYSNIGIAGPLTHAFTADMAELPELDIYAAFAGWHAEHPEIFEIARSEFNLSQLNIANSIIEALQRLNYSEVQTEFLGSFMGESVLVASAVYTSLEGIVVSDGSEVLWYPGTGRARPVGAFEAYSIYKGRRFLRAFNPDLYDRD